MQTSGERRAGRWVDVPLPFRTAIHTSPPHTHTHTTLQEIAPAVTAKFDWLDPKPANAINCPPGYFSANTTGPCEVCGVGFWCPGGFQSTPRRVQVKNALWRWEERETEGNAAQTPRAVPTRPCRPGVPYLHLCFPGRTVCSFISYDVSGVDILHLGVSPATIPPFP